MLDTVSSVITGAENLTALGADGFILFSVVVVGVMFALLLGIVIYTHKAGTKRHELNQKEIIDLTNRVISAESKSENNSRMNQDCQERLASAIKKLENCTDRLLDFKR